MRYFNAWIEAGAEEWEVKHDAGNESLQETAGSFGESDGTGVADTGFSNMSEEVEEEEAPEEQLGGLALQYLYIQMELAQGTLQEYISAKHPLGPVIWDFVGQLVRPPYTVVIFDEISDI